jgi:Xaa-Pro aminopeptidase
VTAPYELVDLSHILHEQRLIKHRDEIRVMQRAARVAAAGHVKAMQTCKPGMTEYQVKAELEYEFQHGGSQFPAYTSIVAGGPNSCILHYIDNNAELHDGDLLLIDAGAEIDCYASDLTRTFPVNGKFSAEQKEIYEIVLAAQQAAMEKALPGFHWDEMHEAAVRIICQGLIDIGLLQGTVDSVIEDKSFQRFYMHRTGHWIGMDVHDVGDYKIDQEWRELEPGMTFTVEPGIYIPAADDVDQKWHNIGIRIEDDVLIQRKGHKVLTEGAPKSIDDIETLMAG